MTVVELKASVTVGPTGGFDSESKELFLSNVVAQAVIFSSLTSRLEVQFHL
jgi:hypothetical protein